MPKLRRIAIVGSILIPILLLLTFHSSSATEFRSADNLFFPDTAIVDDDLFVAGGMIKLDGVIRGDLVAACKSLVQSGVILGSMNSVSRDLDVLGEVKGSVRGFAQNINVNGRLSRNLLAFGYSVDLKPGAEVDMDATIYCSKATLHGNVGGDVEGSMDELIISGTIDGDVSVKAGKITIMPSSRILGDLKYRSCSQAKIESGAQILGETVWTRKEPEKEKKPKAKFTGGFLISEILFLLALMATGVVLTILCKKNAYQAKQAIGGSFLKTLGLGFVFIICIPIGLLFLMITLIGIPIAIICAFAYAVLVYVAKIPVATFVGERILKALGKQGEPSLIWSMLIGLVILTLLLNIPYLSWIIYFVVLFTGFGAIICSHRRSAT